MDFTNKAPKWNAAGAQPSADLQNNGFVAGYKPPAAYFNYMFNRYTAAINELQDNVIAGNSDAVLCTWANGAGWYRIAEYKTTKDSTVQGASANGVELIIKRMYGAVDAEYHHIGLKALYKKSEFYNILSACNAHIITKIRHVVDTTNLVAYIDVYYTGAASTNSTMFIMQNACDSSGCNWKFATPAKVDEALADGQTLYASMNIPTNCTLATDLDLKELKDGTVENANKLGGYGSSYYAKEAEVVANNTDFMVSNWINAGWHRVAKYKADKLTLAEGANANCVELIIKRMYGTSQSEYHHIGLMGLYKKSEFYRIAEACGARVIKKVRHVVDTTNLEAYIDVYYTGVADSNTTAFMLNDARDNSLYWELVTPTLVDEAVADGQTVYAEMDLETKYTPYTGYAELKSELTEKLPHDGSVPMSGALWLAENHARLDGNYLGLVRLTSYPNEAKDDNNKRALELNYNALTDSVRLIEHINGNAKYYPIFGSHNKPSGTYTGNGSATRRTIKTGGISEVIAVWSDIGSALLFPYGAFVAHSTSTNVSNISPTEACTTNGNIDLATTNNMLNANGKTYKWRVL